MGSESEARDESLRPGTITRLVQQRHDPNRVSVFIDGAFALGVHADLVLSFDLHRGRAVTVAELEAVRTADVARAAVAAAMAYIARRARTTHEIRQRLARKGFPEAAAAHALTRLTELGYVDDAAYAHQYVRARFRNKGYGRRRLRAELQRRGVAGPLIEAALAESLTDAEALEAARRHAAARWDRLASEPDPRTRRRKVGDYLVRRGFGPETVWHVIDELEQRDQADVP